MESVKSLIIVTAVLVMAGNVYAVVLFDDFEDGDYTNNPEWVVTNPKGDSLIAADPVRPGNLALASYGTDTAHRVYISYLDKTQSWKGFDFSAEFLASKDNFHPIFALWGDDYRVEMVIKMEPDFSGVRLGISEWGEIHNQILPIRDQVGKWWQINIWHDINADMIHTELRLLDDNSLLGEYVFKPYKYIPNATGISSVKMAFEETDWQYVDNITLIPEPVSLVILAVGSLAVLRKKRN